MTSNKQAVNIRWKIKDALYAIFLDMFLFGVVLVLIHRIYKMMGGAVPFADYIQGNAVVILMIFMIQTLITLFCLWLYSVHKYKVGLRDLGFIKISILKLVGFVALAFVINFLIGALVLMLKNKYGIDLPGFDMQESHIKLFGNNKVGVMILTVLAVFVAPIVEEVFFRGFVQQTMVKRFGEWGGIILAALLFAVAHMEFKSFSALLVLSILLGWIFYKSKSLWPAITFHATNNLLALIVEYFIANGGGK